MIATQETSGDDAPQEMTGIRGHEDTTEGFTGFPGPPPTCPPSPDDSSEWIARYLVEEENQRGTIARHPKVTFDDISSQATAQGVPISLPAELEDSASQHFRSAFQAASFQTHLEKEKLKWALTSVQVENLALRRELLMQQQKHEKGSLSSSILVGSAEKQQQTHRRVNFVQRQPGKQAGGVPHATTYHESERLSRRGDEGAKKNGWQPHANNVQDEQAFKLSAAQSLCELADSGNNRANSESSLLKENLKTKAGDHSSRTEHATAQDAPAQTKTIQVEEGTGSSSPELFGYSNQTSLQGNPFSLDMVTPPDSPTIASEQQLVGGQQLGRSPHLVTPDASSVDLQRRRVSMEAFMVTKDRNEATSYNHGYLSLRRKVSNMASPRFEELAHNAKRNSQLSAANPGNGHDSLRSLYHESSKYRLKGRAAVPATPFTSRGAEERDPLGSAFQQRESDLSRTTAERSMNYGSRLMPPPFLPYQYRQNLLLFPPPVATGLQPALSPFSTTPSPLVSPQMPSPIPKPAASSFPPTRRCQHPSMCAKRAQGRTKFCKAHGGGRRCQWKSPDGGRCTKTEYARGFCSKHGGRRKCQQDNCDKYVRGTTPFCMGHGGGFRCSAPVCKRGAVPGSKLCSAHGGGKRCQYSSPVTPLGTCHKGAQGGTPYCKAHGGGKQCRMVACVRREYTKGLCKQHTNGDVAAL